MLDSIARKKLGAGLIAGITAASLYVSPAYADDNLESSVQDFNQQIEPIDVIIESAFAYGLKILLHEFGHYSTARLMGYESTMHGPGVHGDTFHVAYTEIFWRGPKDLPRDHKLLFSSAGIGFTSFGNILLTNYLVNSDNDNSFRPFLGAFSLVMMLDRYSYVTNSATWHFAGQEPIEGDDISHWINATGINQDLGYALLLAGTMIETVLRWGEVAYLYQTLIGNNPEYNDSGFIFSFVPGEDSVSINISGRLPY